MKYFKKLVGDRIYLSPRSTEDYEIFTEWLNDFETTDYLGRSGQLQSISAEKEYLENSSNPKSTFVIVTLNEDKMIGTVGLEKFDDIYQVYYADLDKKIDELDTQIKNEKNKQKQLE